MDKKIEVGSIVKGKYFGEFVVLAFREIGNEHYAQLKEYKRETNELCRGECSLPLEDLVPTGEYFFDKNSV